MVYIRLCSLQQLYLATSLAYVIQVRDSSWCLLELPPKKYHCSVECWLGFRSCLLLCNCYTITYRLQVVPNLVLSCTLTWLLPCWYRLLSPTICSDIVSICLVIVDIILYCLFCGMQLVTSLLSNCFLTLFTRTWKLPYRVIQRTT